MDDGRTESLFLNFPSIFFNFDKRASTDGRQLLLQSQEGSAESNHCRLKRGSPLVQDPEWALTVLTLPNREGNILLPVLLLLLLLS